MKVKLSDAFELQMGKTPDRSDSSCWSGAHKWVSIADLSKADKYIIDTKETISDTGVAKSGIKVVPKGTVIMSFKLSIGKTAITTEDLYTNEAIMAFIDKGIYEIDTNYIYHLFASKDWNEGTNKAVLGLTLNKATLSQVEIEIPSIAEQKQVVEVLDKVDELISLRTKQLQKLDDLVKSRFVEMFGDVEKNSKHWNTVQLSQLCDLQNGYAFKSDDYLPKSNVINCRMSNIRPDGGFDAEYNPKYLPDEYWMKYQAYQLHDGDVIIAMTDMASDPKILGVPTIVKTKGKRFLLNQRVGKLIFLDDGRMNRVYLMYYLGQAFIRKNLAKLAGGSTQINVGKPEILSIKVQEPPAELQELFSNEYERIISFKQTVKQGLDKLEQMKQALMQKYFG